MRVIFSRAPNVASWFIRLLTFSKWSHVALVDGALVYEAIYPRVRVTPLADFLKRNRDFEYRTIEGDPRLILAEVGKPYDLLAVVAMLNPWRGWNTDDKWFCSELIAHSTGRFFDAGRVTPQMLYLISRPV